MSDARVRELEHRWQTTGDVEDGAAFLREARRAGRLSLERAALAAYAREPSAVLAFGLPPGPAPDDLSRWVAGLAPWGRVLCVRVALAGLEPALAATADVDDLRPDVAHLVSWCARPHRGKLLSWARRCARDGPHRLPNGAPREVANAVHLTARAAVEEPFGAHAATAVNRLQQVLGAAALRPVLLEVVRREALGA